MKKDYKRINLKEAGVNITPLMDVLTVLLFFLIQTLEVNSLTFTPPKDVVIPSSMKNTDSIDEALKIFFSGSQLLVEDKVILTLDQEKIHKKDLLKDGRTIRLLKDFLTEQHQKRKDFYKGVKTDGAPVEIHPAKIIIAADKDLPFGLLKYLLHTLAVSNYTDYQFVVKVEK